MKYEPFLKDGFLAWTLTSNGYKHLTWNLALQWSKSVPGQPLCILCADKPSFQFLQQQGVRCVLADTLVTDFGPKIVRFGCRQFAVLNRLKLRLLEAFAKDPAVAECLYIDGDIAVYKDIVSGVKGKLGEHPFWAQCDEQGFECSDLSGCSMLCSGLIAWRHGADGGVFQVTEKEVWDAKPEDQVWFNYALRKQGVRCWTLPPAEYPNGSRLKKVLEDPSLKASAFCAHYNHRVGDAKVRDMKKYGDWVLPYPY